MLQELSTFDWESVFDFIKEFTREQIVSIFAYSNGEEECDPWIGIFKLEDGRYLSVSGFCPYYTGWEIGGTVRYEVHSTVQNAWFLGLDESERKRLYPCVAEIVDSWPAAELDPAIWHVYIIRCKDGSFYTGIAKNPDMRFAAHAAGEGAKYTKGRGPLALVYKRPVGSHGDACRREIEIKKLSRKEKEALIAISYGGVLS